MNISTEGRFMPYGYGQVTDVTSDEIKTKLNLLKKK